MSVLISWDQYKFTKNMSLKDYAFYFFKRLTSDSQAVWADTTDSYQNFQRKFLPNLLGW